MAFAEVSERTADGMRIRPSHSCQRPAACGRNLCHQAIFVDDATRAVMPPDPEMIQVGGAIWQRPQWRGLVQGAVRPVGVVEVLVLPRHHHQVALVPDKVWSSSSCRQLPIHRSMIEFIRGA